MVSTRPASIALASLAVFGFAAGHPAVAHGPISPLNYSMLSGGLGKLTEGVIRT